VLAADDIDDPADGLDIRNRLRFGYAADQLQEKKAHDRISHIAVTRHPMDRKGHKCIGDERVEQGRVVADQNKRGLDCPEQLDIDAGDPVYPPEPEAVGVPQQPCKNLKFVG